jgi:tyrosyl-DNA phosphodiesterase 1
MEASDMDRVLRSLFRPETRARICAVRPATPPYGTVHSKAVLTFCGSAGCRIFIHTANDDASDWELKSAGSRRAAEFEKSLVDYAQQLGITGRVRASVVDSLVSEISRYDFSDAGCALITSVPGKHAGPMRAKYGHLRLRTLLCAEDIDESSDDSSVVVQFSSLGSIQKKWLEEFMLSLFASRSRTRAAGASTRPGKASDRLEFVLPTMSNMANGIESWAAGRALPITGRNVHREHVLSRLHGWNCPRASGRSHAMPHVKSLLRYSRRCPDQLAWVVIGSANLSAAAWGAQRMSSGAFDILSYEMGVLITPERYKLPTFHIGEPLHAMIGEMHSAPFTLRVASWEAQAQFPAPALSVVAPIPFSIPPVPYEPHDVPWHIDPGGPACDPATNGRNRCTVALASLMQAQRRASLRDT